MKAIFTVEKDHTSEPDDRYNLAGFETLTVESDKEYIAYRLYDGDGELSLEGKVLSDDTLMLTLYEWGIAQVGVTEMRIADGPDGEFQVLF